MQNNMNARARLEEIAESRGWSEATMNFLFRSWVMSNTDRAWEFVSDLLDVVETENEE